MGMPLPSSFSYNNQLNRDSSTKVYPSSSSQPINSSVHGDSQTFNPRPTQTLNNCPLYNPETNHHIQVSKLRRDLDPEIDPGSASAGGGRANRSSCSPLPLPLTSPPQPVSSTDPLIRYRECLKNHAASMGAHVLDGCGEFMPSGEQGTMGALKCAACECHRNFHRKEINGESQYAPPPPSRYHTGKNSVVHLQQPTPLNQQRFPLGLSISTSSTAVPIAPVMMNFGRDGRYGGGRTESSSEDLNMFHQGGQSPHYIIPQSSKKRFRTKFSQDQKVKMMEFAQKLDWRIQKQDEQELQQFCAQVGVKRQVFKVWMHNNKQAMKKKQM
ncbi:putative DNA-3-methyladenine glycosylase [Hibiscus syriacus]|uniref:DNA-3-methyladenine glycosylase n=2 Tax=Hibiscus syriacus TaxID=106335 RepID=A0A6A3AXS0_HIBSY|nr:putative DNA-3-methyladenine glycosylase [Hibiscus syriacus]